MQAEKEVFHGRIGICIKIQLRQKVWGRGDGNITPRMLTRSYRYFDADPVEALVGDMNLKMVLEAEMYNNE